jgi:hypothetical protein
MKGDFLCNQEIKSYAKQKLKMPIYNDCGWD